MQVSRSKSSPTPQTLGEFAQSVLKEFCRYNMMLKTMRLALNGLGVETILEWLAGFGTALKGLQGKHVDAVLAFLLFSAFLLALDHGLDPLWCFAALIVVYVLYLFKTELVGRREERIAMQKLTNDTEKRRSRLARKLPAGKVAQPSRAEETE